MMRSVRSVLLLGVAVSALPAADPPPVVRPISEAESVLAVFYDDWALAGARDPALILAGWPDGRVVWSGDRLRGGPPYREGRIAAKKVTGLLGRLERDGHFADKGLNAGYVDWHDEFQTVLIKSGKKQVEMRSRHELVEEAGRGVAVHWELPRPAERRLDVLRDAPRDYLYFRLVWTETRNKLTDLIPAEGTPTAGTAVKEGGVFSWHEPAAPPGK
jgi:hypothetical protein